MVPMGPTAALLARRPRVNCHIANANLNIFNRPRLGPFNPRPSRPFIPLVHLFECSGLLSIRRIWADPFSK